MIYVQRDGDGVVTGLFAQRQPGLAEEALAEDAAEVQAFRARMQPNPVRERIDALERQHMLPRAVREFMLAVVAERAVAGGQSPTVLPAFVKLKALDDQIAALRSQL